MTINVNELSAVVVQHIEDPKTWDALARRTAFMNHLMGEGKEKIDGGLHIQFPLKVLANASSGFISGTTALTDVNPSQQLVFGTLNWKYYNFNVNFGLNDFTIANGRNEIINFMTKKTEGALNDSIREMSTAFHGSSASAPLNPEGLLDVVAASGTSYASLLDTDYLTGTYLPIIDGTTTAVNYTNVNLMLNKLKARLQKDLSPTAIFGLMNESVYSKFQSSVQNQQRFTETAELKAGSEGFKINGTTFILDADTPGSKDGSTADNYLYIFPTDIIKLEYRFGFGSPSPFDGETKMPRQPIMSTQHYMAFNLVCDNRRLVAVFKTLIA